MENTDILAGAHGPGESWANLGLGTGPSRGGSECGSEVDSFMISQKKMVDSFSNAIFIMKTNYKLSYIKNI